MSDTLSIGPCCELTCFNREIRLWIIIKDGVPVKEPAKARNLRRQIHDDNLHLDVQFEFQDFRAGLQCLRSSRDKHVTLKSQHLQSIDELAKLCTPSEYTELCALLSRVDEEVRNTRLAVLLEAFIQYKVSCAQSADKCVILLYHTRKRLISG